MQLLDAHNLETYLRERGWIDNREQVEIRALTGGVSNQVLFVGRKPAAQSFVVKQARPQLRVDDPWFCSVDRIAREIAVIEACGQLLAGLDQPAIHAVVPTIVAVDPENYCFAMSAAPAEHVVWKTLLLSGQADQNIARRCGTLLGTLHAQSWRHVGLEQALNDRQFFIDLRLDPYYRHLSRLFPEDSERLDWLVDLVLENRHSLVHADFSPKNLLVYDDGLMLVDFETGHFGDPAFDLGFFLSHLVLKTVYRAPQVTSYLGLITAFWEEYLLVVSARLTAAERNSLEDRAVLNLAGCLWARLDGKSKIDYLSNASQRDLVRRLARGWLYESPKLDEAVQQLDAAVAQLKPD